MIRINCIKNGCISEKQKYKELKIIVCKLANRRFTYYSVQGMSYKHLFVWVSPSCKEQKKSEKFKMKIYVFGMDRTSDPRL